MSVSKSFVQLPALLFFILATLVGTHVSSNDRINTYELTPEGGESSILSIRERSKDGAHILLSEFRCDACQQKADQQRAASAVTNPARGVTRLIPDVNHSGSSNSHSVVYHPPLSILDPLNPDMRVYERHHSLPGVTIPSFSVLNGLSSLPVEGESRILALPLPARIPFQHPKTPGKLLLVYGDIRQPVLESRDASTFIVRGNVLLGGMRADTPLGPFNRELTGVDAPVKAVFTYNPADDSVQLREFRVPHFITITHTDSRETSEHDGDMESFWLQLERYQKQQLRKVKQQEYINGLEAREQEILRTEISQRQRGVVSRGWQIRRLYDDYEAFMARLDNEDEAPVSSTPAVDPVNRARFSNQEYAVYLIRKLGSQGVIYDENSDTLMLAFEGNSAGAESSMPEGGDAGMEFESGTAGNDSVSNAPVNQPIELLRGGRAQLSFGVQSHSK